MGFQKPFQGQEFAFHRAGLSRKKHPILPAKYQRSHRAEDYPIVVFQGGVNKQTGENEQSQ